MFARSNIYFYSIVKELFTPIIYLRVDIQQQLIMEIVREDTLGGIDDNEDMEPEDGTD